MAAAEPPILPIHEMHERHPGLTPAVSNGIQEAAAVCLNRRHTPPLVEFVIDNDGEQLSASVEWNAPNERQRLAWADEQRATEHGAEACALAALELSRNVVAVARSRRGTGADYLVSESASSSDDLEDAMRFEVSGTDRGNSAEIAYRLRRKIEQLNRAGDDRPGLAAVVGFASREIRLAEAE